MLREDTDHYQLEVPGLTLRIGKRDGNPGWELQRNIRWGRISICDEWDDSIRNVPDAVDMCAEGNVLRLYKSFGPFRLTERYTVGAVEIAWLAELTVEAADFRSVRIRYELAAPANFDQMEFWTARERMPQPVCKYPYGEFEYGDVTGITLPVAAWTKRGSMPGIALAMPLDFDAPRFSFCFGSRCEYFGGKFHDLALQAGMTARASLLLTGAADGWRPVLGWFFERHRNYFEPATAAARELWGGQLSGSFHTTGPEADAMKALGVTWYELHEFFPAYGDYLPKADGAWPSGHVKGRDPVPVTPAAIEETIALLHARGIRVMPYLQVTGDCDTALAYGRFADAVVRTPVNGPMACPHYDVVRVNSDPSLSFGREMTRMLPQLVERFRHTDGFFVDQMCYNLIDLAHFDGVSAHRNQPAYLTGRNYHQHLSALRRRIGEDKVLIGNGVFSGAVLQYVDAFVAEGSDWLCDQFSYYSIGGKAMFFLMYSTDERKLEGMFRNCLVYGAGFTGYPAALEFQPLFDRYRLLLERMRGRRWVFDPDPLELPPETAGNIYRSPAGAILVAAVSRLSGFGRGRAVLVRLPELRGTCPRVTAYRPGREPGNIAPVPDGTGWRLPLEEDSEAVLFEIIPGNGSGKINESAF